MTLCNQWGQGQIFAFSGMEGKTDLLHGLCGTLLGDRVGIRFRIPDSCDLFLSHGDYRELSFSAVTGDMILGSADGEPFSFVFYDAYTVAGLIPDCCRLSLFREAGDNVAFVLKQKGNRYAFACGNDWESAEKRAQSGLEANIEKVIQKRFDFYKRWSEPGEKEKLVYKCLSVMRTQVLSPEGKLVLRWSTPDRYPHKYAWLWDSVFHAIGFRHVDGPLAQELLETVFTHQRADGFLPHMNWPDRSSQITQPPVIGYGALKVFETTGDKAFLSRVFTKNRAFLQWCLRNRQGVDISLYFWHRSEDVHCRCDESGMDNSTRFDTDSALYAIDFSCYMAQEMRCMAKIASILGEDPTSFEEKYKGICSDIQNVLWDPENGFFGDYDIDRQKPHSIISVASFLPLFAGVCREEQAKQLVSHLSDPKTFGTPLPIPSLPAESSYFGDDMWRGPVWVNMNYMICEGLDDYGYGELADEIRRKTVSAVKKYYAQTGCLFEYYDSLNETPPHRLNRKGAALEPYDPGVKMQTIRDYGWTTTLVLDMLIGKTPGQQE